eukprot:CAMPEP_0118829388 /NCGR_PEP_ID=MMETSP1162-20130426/23058_1 /TAXON_ID=33656 /ORGANISM="Phaeocystis Sp, Strain CCMP2710" /LENGTH=331 /DNA_ID=CAMNT_0006760559 /DNA_START=44 /DNA_END=1039 /DNA_ORIENTATION=+
MFSTSPMHPINVQKRQLRTATGAFAAPAPAESAGPVAFLKDFLAGGIAGAVAKTATAPIERVKLLIQTQDANPKIISGEVKRYTGIVDCFTRVSAEQGFSAFWRGNTVNVIRYFPTQAFNFAFKDTIKAMFPKYNPKTEFWSFFASNMASGGLAGAGSLTIVYPLDYARTRLASDVGSGNPQFSGLFDCLTKTMAQGGFFSMYNGFGVSVIGIVAYRGPYFGLYDTLKAKNPFKDTKGPVGLVSKFCIAQFTAIAAGFISYPFDTVRRRLQMQAEKPKEEWLYNGTLDCAVKIVKDEGMGAIFKGFGANVLRTLGGALVLVGYDEIKALIA